MPRNKISDFDKKIRAAIAQNLKRYTSSITQGQLSEMTGIPASTISGYFAERSTPNAGQVQKIADALGVDKADIDPRFSAPAAPRKKGVKIPVLGYVAAGIPFEAIENVIDEEEIDEVLASKGDFFGLVIHGQSMEPEICDGDTVIVRKQETCESRQIAIVLINGYDATCKIVHRQPDGILLEGINRDVYTPTFYSNEAIKNLPVQIVGIVAEVRRKYPI